MEQSFVLQGRGQCASAVTPFEWVYWRGHRLVEAESAAEVSVQMVSAMLASTPELEQEW